MSEHEEEEPEIKPLKPKVRWVMPQRLDFITFVGKDVVAIAHDIYIVFLNVKTLTELVYVANCHERGDGVDVISGHKSNLFTFTEKVKRGRIFVVNYPHFDVIAELTDTDVNRYKGICMMECDMIAGFSGFPDYMLSIWSWRTKQRLISLPAGVVRRDQIYMSSRTHVLVCQCWGEGLTVWEIAPCYKKCLIMKRTKEEKTGWEISDPTIVGVCWSNEGQLYAIDKHANLYGVVSDGINMVSNLEWTSDLTGPNWTCICSFLNGVLIYGPDNFIRSLKKTETSWKVVWSHKCSEPQVVRRLVSNSFSDEVVMWTKTGFAYRLWGESEENVHIQLFCYKQRNITRIQLIAPDFTHVAAMDKDGGLGFYEVFSGQLVTMKFIEGNDLFFQASPIEPVVAVCGEVGQNYGLAILEFSAKGTVTKVSSMALTHQIVSKVVFSPKGRDIIAAAMSAGHIFILKLSTDYKLTLTRYAELGRGLADCFLMSVGEMMRAFSLVLFSDRYLIGERIICINADTGKDNKFAGKMQGPYARLLPLSVKDTMLAIPHMSTSYHVLKLSGEKGVTVTVKMGPIIETGHHLKQFDGFYNFGAFLTFSADGTVFVRPPDGVQEADYNIVVSHRYEHGVKQAVMDTHNQVVVHLASNQTSACVYPDGAAASLQTHAQRRALDPALFLTEHHTITIISVNDKNYLDLQEEKKVKEEAMDYKKQRIDIVKSFEIIQKKLLELLEENITEVPLHQLSLSEFNLHLENKKERLKQAEREREDIRLQTEAQIRAQDKVTQWIKKTCWDTMLTPRVKMYAIFSHYHVENYAVLPSQRDKWPQLERLTELCGVEADADADVFRPWEEPEPEPQPTREASTKSQLLTKSQVLGESATTLERATRSRRASPDTELSGSQLRTPHALAHSAAHQYVPVPPAMTPQTLAYSFLHMNYLYHIIKLNVQNMRLWFNKQFDELMVFKKREVGLVEERNSRLRFIIEELNKLSDLRGSFHHLVITIQDPQWRQEEQPQRLIKVDPEECSIEPYISPSQIVIIPPDPGPKDDFKERALIEMMDGVLEKLWHEEIKKPIPLPQCMLDKEPENFNEEDLRHVFEYEAKVRFRNEEREKYRKMLHAEYAKLTQTVNEGIVKFNMRVKEMWLTKLKVESVIGQETLHLMRLRRTNLDRVEGAEKLEGMRQEISKLEAQVETLSGELQQIQEQGEECQATYEALAQRDKYQDRTYKNHFADLSPIIVDQCYKFFRKRPKWNQRTSVIPAVLYDLAQSVLTGQRAPMMPHECVDYYRGVDQLDLISNMPAVMDEALWATMCKLRRIKIENEIRMRAVVQESAYVESAAALWARAAAARRTRLALLAEDIRLHRERTELCSRNKTIQLVLPAGQVEIITTGHMEDYDDAALIPREDIEKINNLILKVGDMKLRMMRKQMEFRKGILAREWEHAQMKMKLRHMEQELYSYQRLKIPKELQLYLKNKELGYTDEQDYMRLEKEMEASKTSINKILNQQIQRVEEVELKINAIAAQDKNLVNMIVDLNVKVSEKRIKEDPLEPIRHRRIFKNRMETLVQRSQLVREVQQNHTTVVMLQTELELLRLKTYPTLASFRTLDC